MKYRIIPLLLCLLLAGCSTKYEEFSSPSTEASTQIANPWKDYASLEEAEAACRLDFPMPETVADSYVAESFRIMNGQLLEVRYRDGEFPVTIRMQAGEGHDLSGVYGESENVQTYESEGAAVIEKNIDGGILQLISKDGFSYSLYAPNHYRGDSNAEFLQYIYEAS